MTRSNEERRDLALATAGPQLRAAGEGTSVMGFDGHAAVFSQRTAIGNPLTWGFYEEIAPGAFTKTLAEGDARFLVDHDTRLVVSRVSAGSLRLAQDQVGLAVDADLDTRLSYVNDLVVNLDLRNITGMSFGFRTVKDEWTTVTVQTSEGDMEAELRILRQAERPGRHAGDDQAGVVVDEEPGVPLRQGLGERARRDLLVEPPRQRVPDRCALGEHGGMAVEAAHILALTGRAQLHPGRSQGEVTALLVTAGHRRRRLPRGARVRD